MPSRHDKSRTQFTIRLDGDTAERIKAKAKTEGKTVNAVTDALYQEYLDGPVAAPAASATYEQVESLKLGMLKLAGGMQAIAEQQAAQAARLEAIQAGVSEPAALPAPVDVSGIESGIAALKAQLDEMQERTSTPEVYLRGVPVAEDTLEQKLADLNYVISASSALRTHDGDNDLIKALVAKYRLCE